MTTAPGDKAGPKRPDVFISYSRKDREFVKRLEAELQSRGREAWVDWEGIRPAERFMEAIFPAIEGTDTFVFVISPDSVTSDVCGKELAHAAAHNKRMVPIFAREVDAKTVPKPLAELNWVFFCRENDSFEVGTDTLVNALDTDLDWVHAHTRLLTRAIEWAAKSKSNSFVLRGEDLRAAEQWLAQAGTEKERQPTALQTEYIIASRKAAARRQRITLGAVSFGLVLAVVLAILAWFQRDKALASLSQSDFAEGTRLTNADQPGRALPYFARAVRLTGHPASATRIASLLTQRAWPMPRAARKQSDATQAFYSADGRKAVAALPDGSIVLREGETSRPIAVLARGRDVIAACFSPDGAFLVTLITMADKQSIAAQFWNAETGAQTGESEAVPGQYHDTVTDAMGFIGGIDERGIPLDTLIFFSANGSRVVVHLQGKSAVWDARKPRKLFDLPGDLSIASFSADGERLATIGFDKGPAVNVWKTATGSLLRRIPVPEKTDFRSYALSRDGARVALSYSPKNNQSDYYVCIYEVASGKAAMPVAHAGHGVSSVEINANGRLLLLGGAGGASVWDAATGKPLGPVLRHPSGIDLRSASFSPEGGRVLTLAEDGTMRIWDATTMLPLMAFDYSDAESAAWSVDGSAVVIARSHGTQQGSWSVFGGAAAPRLLPGREHGYHGFLLVTVDDQSDAPATSASPSPQDPVGHAYFWDLQSGKKLMEAAATLMAGLNRACFSTDGQRVALESTAGLRMWDIKTKREFELKSFSANPILSPDQTMVLNPSGYEAPMVADVEGDKPARELQVEKAVGEVCSGRFSPDGRFIATYCPGGSIQIWDSASAKQIQRFAVPATNNNAPPLEFSSDSRRLFTSGTDVRAWDFQKGTALGNPITGRWKGWCFNTSGSRIAVVTDESITVLDTNTGAPVWPPLLLKDQPKHRADAEVPVFSPDGRLLATYAGSSPGGSVCQLWDAETGHPLLDPIRPPVGWQFIEMSFSPDSARLVAGCTSQEDQNKGKGLAIIIDTSTGAELWREEFSADNVTSNHFTPDGCQLVVGSNRTRVWDIAPPGKAPAFLADVAEVASGLRLNDAGAPEPLTDPAAEWDRVRKQLAGLDAANRWGQISRWFFAEPSQRPRSPYAGVDERETSAKAPE